MNRVFRYLLQYGLGFGLLAWVVASHWTIATDAGEDVGLSAALRGPVHVLPLLAAAALSLLASLLSFVRWYFLVRAQDLPLSLLQAFRLGMIGNYFNAFLPGSVGGDVVKAFFLVREQQRRIVAVATLVVDRVVGLWGLLCLGLLTGAVFWGLGGFEQLQLAPATWIALRAIYLAAAALVVLLTLFWFGLRLFPLSWGESIGERLRRVPRLGPALHEMWLSAWIYRGRSRTIFLTLFFAVVGHACLTLSFYSAAATLRPREANPGLAAHFVLVPAGQIIQAGVPTPGGVGGGEFGFGALYECFGAPFAAGVLGSLVYRAIAWLWGLVGYLLYWRLRPATLPQEEKELAPTAVS